MLLIDGCEIGCGLAILKRHNIEPQNYLVVTKLGIEKNKNFDLKEDEISLVVEKCLEMCGCKPER